MAGALQLHNPLLIVILANYLSRIISLIDFIGGKHIEICTPSNVRSSSSRHKSHIYDLTLSLKFREIVFWLVTIFLVSLFEPAPN